MNNVAMLLRPRRETGAFVLVRAGCCLSMLAMILLARPTRAQVTEPFGRVMTDSVCSYRTCALTIAPRWNGLGVFSGSAGPQLANLNFFVPRSISTTLVGRDPAVSGADSAAAYARSALRLRRTGAVLTDGGLLLGAATVLHAIRDHGHRRRDAVVGGVGGAVLLLGIPFQFAADGALSHAVWWHNLRYVR